MPDITMCQNETCDLRKDCFRFMAVPNQYRQSFFAEDPTPINGKCIHFMKLNNAYELKTPTPNGTK